ncbi:MAG TPA: GAF domain-containing protein [Conexibacter sp.]
MPSEFPDLPARTSSTEQQASLRRVAALAAAATSPSDVFAAIAEEVAAVVPPTLVHIWRWERNGSATVVGTWGNVPNPFPARSNWAWEHPDLVALAQAARAGNPVLVPDLWQLRCPLSAKKRDAGIGAAVVAPIAVDGKPWGVIDVGIAQGTPLAERVDERLAEFAELVTPAIASGASQEELVRLADEQAALRRVATLVAHGAPAAEVFDTVVTALGALLDVGSTGLVRFELHDVATVMACWGTFAEGVRVGARLPIGGMNVVSQVARTGRPSLLDNFERYGSGAIGDQAHRVGTSASVGGPIIVAGKLWGAMIAAAQVGNSLAPDAGPRLGQFTELVAAAIANSEARVEVARLADEQAALRRVATKVAHEPPAAELFATVAEEVAGILGGGLDSVVVRYDDEETATVVAVHGERPPSRVKVGESVPVDGSGVVGRALRERRPVRVDDVATADGTMARHAREHGVRAAVACPIVVKGRVWGATIVARYDDEPFPRGTEQRVSQFTDLAATAIANAQARDDVKRLADVQAALRRVATLVAEGAAPIEVFDAVIVQVAQLLGAAQVAMKRVESPREVSILANRGQDPALVYPGLRLSSDGDSVTARVLRTGRSARIDFREEGSGTIADLVRRLNVNTSVGAPVMLEGEVWGVITASWDGRELPPADAEERLAEFAQLVGTAIANADSRDQLEASRARVLTAGDEARRKVVRDLHDGAQQRLVNTIVTLKLAQQASGDREREESLRADALQQAEQAIAALRELAHGILPSVLTHGGLSAAVTSLISRLDFPVEMRVERTRLRPEIEASAYFFIAEALTNVVKHARARRAEVTVAVAGETLRVEVRDDGVGGADPRGHGLLGLGDRVEAHGGLLRIDSPPGAGTLLSAQLPLPA